VDRGRCSSDCISISEGAKECDRVAPPAGPPTIYDEAFPGFGGRKWLTYQRYDLRFQSKWLKETLGLDIAHKDLIGLDAMDNARNLAQLADLGLRMLNNRFSRIIFQRHLTRRRPAAMPKAAFQSIRPSSYHCSKSGKEHA
jgi:hypothetical protein